jgi:hypothetical protein
VHKPGCWIDIFELSHYRGRRRRLFGPSRFHAVRCRLPAWGISIDSVILGPDAFVRLFASSDPHRSVVWLMPRQSVGDVVERGITDLVDSLDITHAPPAPGEAGYEQYHWQLKQHDPGTRAPRSVQESELD